MRTNGNCLWPQMEVTESGGDRGNALPKGESCYSALANHCQVGELVMYCYTFLFLKESGNKKFCGKDLNFLMLATSSNCSKILCRPTG